jgi:hypothetical protein
MSQFFAALLICILAAGEPSCKVESRIVASPVQCQKFSQEIFLALQKRYPKGTPIAVRGLCLVMPKGEKS